jgi:hypothetical protein
MTEFEEAIRERALLWWGDNTFAPWIKGAFAPKTEQEIIEHFWAWYLGYEYRSRQSYH